MKKYIYIALAITCMGLMGCQNETPFDTQSPDDDPIILKPYNESGTGSFTYILANPDTPLFDSVTVTPSSYTTVNWYIDDVLVYTGTKIEEYFYAGSYTLRIEAVTSAGKSTHRDGSVTVNPYDTDPQANTPAGGRHLVPGVEMTVEGQNLDDVSKLVVTGDLYGNDVICTIDPTYQEDGLIKFIMPATADGEYYLFFQDAQGNRYGADQVQVHNGAVVLGGYDTFVPESEWVITGVNLQDVASVKVDETVITDLTVTATSVTLTAPAAEVGAHTLSMKNKDGSDVMFVTAAGTLTEVLTVVSAETTIWTGPAALAWDAEVVKVTKETMADIAVGSTIYLYFEVQAGAEYYALRVTTPWWDGYDLVPQIDGANTLPNPYGFEYTAERKGFVETCGAMSVVGNGLTITKITYK